jgi:hypothetical protein
MTMAQRPEDFVDRRSVAMPRTSGGGENVTPRGAMRIGGFNRLRGDLFGVIHVCYAPIATKFRVAAE